MFKFFTNRAPLLRAAGVISAVGIIVTSVTYAALQSPQANLTGNTIQSASANLVIGTTSATSTSFASSKAGFTFANVVPGGPAMPADGNTFYLKNTGSVGLALKMSVGSTPTNTSAIDLSKVFIQITRVDTTTTQTFSLDSLVASSATGGVALTDSLLPSSTGTAYKLSASMAADAFTGSSASIGAIDFVFGGTAVTN